MPYNPFKAIVAPRPIGWISTISANGNANLAPYSFFNAVSDTPEMVAFGSAGAKDTVRNIRQTGEFVCNYASWDLRDEMNISSAPVDADVNEFDLAKLETAKCNLVNPPRVKDAPAALECKLFEIVELKPQGKGNYLLVIGEVVGVHMRDDCIVDGRFDVTRAGPITRMGYRDYSTLGDLFQMNRPNED